MTPGSPSAPSLHPLSTQVSQQRCFFLDLRAAGPLSIAYGGCERCNPDYSISRENFTYTVVELVTEGRGTVSLGGAARPLRPGSLFAYTRDTRLEIRSDPGAPMTKYFLCLTGRRVWPRLRRAGLPADRPVALSLFAELQDIFEDLIREGRHGRATSARVCAALGEVLLLKIEELSRWSGRGGRKAEAEFLRCRSYIDQQADVLKTLGEIAAAMRLSSVQLCRLFRRYQGMSPYQYLLRRKMTRAAELLMDSRCLVKEAAQRVGFDDPYHFSRRFKAVHGISPRALAANSEPGTGPGLRAS